MERKWQMQGALEMALRLTIGPNENIKHEMDVSMSKPQFKYILAYQCLYYSKHLITKDYIPIMTKFKV